MKFFISILAIGVLGATGLFGATHEGAGMTFDLTSNESRIVTNALVSNAPGLMDCESTLATPMTAAASSAFAKYLDAAFQEGRDQVTCRQVKARPVRLSRDKPPVCGIYALSHCSSL